MLTGLPPAGDMAILPLQVPEANELELTVTVRGFNGVAPEVTLVESQLPPLVVVDATVKETEAEPEVLVTLRVWAAGLDANAVEKVSDVGVTVTLLLAGGVYEVWRRAVGAGYGCAGYVVL